MKPYVMLVLIAVSAGLGALLGLGAGAVLAALITMFCMIAAFGGTLAADLRLLAWFGPLLVVVVGVIRVLHPVSSWLAIALVTVVVFAVGLVPVIGTRFITVGMALGMATVFAYGIQIATTVWQSFAAPALAVIVVLVFRWISGRQDPEAPLRAAFAGALSSDAPAAREHAYAQWWADGPRAWTTRALVGLARFRNAARVLQSRRRLVTGPAGEQIEQVLTAAEAEASRLAGLVTVREQSDPNDRVRRSGLTEVLPGATRELMTSLWQGLETVQAATADRDRSRGERPDYLRKDSVRDAIRGALNWNSVQLRHAVRCALGMLIALVVAQFFTTNPLVPSFLMAVFAIMQPQLQDSMRLATQRVYGAVGGAAALALIIVLGLPEPALMPVGVMAMVVGMLFFQRTQPIVFNGCTVLMSVGLNVNLRHIELRQMLLEYLLMMAIAVLIALGFGFVAVPGVPVAGLASRFDDAVRDTQALLRELTAGLVNHNVEPHRLRPLFRAVTGAQQNLRAVDAVTPEPSPEQVEAAEAAADAVQGLSTSASALLSRSRSSVVLVPAVGELARQLDARVRPDPTLIDLRLPAVIDEEQRLLLDTMTASADALSQAGEQLSAQPTPR
ncbi:hypothetical protein [Pseudonocardia spinosispora]|uniref:hypothetical protein n=1 Tax=Pseudonocardia spinosispora TaxID=103441 RepID=UPI000417AD86|nr:hypothetical protein [Pseudonocardia spinosispora]